MRDDKWRDRTPPTPELLECAAEAIVREWTSKYFGISLEDARAAVERCLVKQQQLGPELARAEAEAYLWPDDDRVIDLTDIPQQRSGHVLAERPL